MGYVRTIALLGVVGLTALAAPASAHEPSAAEERVPALVERALGGDVVALRNGLYRVEGPGPDFKTHGPDLRGTIDDSADHGSGFGPGDAERAPVCAADPGAEHYQEILYGYPAYAEDDVATQAPQIRAAVRRMNAVLNAESEASGGPTADYVVRCDEQGEIRVGSFPVPIASGSASFSQVVTAARAAGYVNPSADYSIFYDGSGPSGVCGTGTFYFDEEPGASNWNNNPPGNTYGGYGVTYDGCWFGSTPMHENGHNQGAVQYSAPYSTGDGAHCYDENDVMCYSPDGGDKHQQGTISRCTDRLHFDCGNDSYFDSAPEPGEWLASHWNIGSAANRFVSLGGGEGNDAPVAAFSSSCAGLSCSFSDASTDSDGSIVSRSWSFGDAAGAAGVAASHDYGAAGSYLVTLTVVDDDGASDVASRQLQVTAPAAVGTGGSATGSGSTGDGSTGGGDSTEGDDESPAGTLIDVLPRTRLTRGPAFRTRERRAVFTLESDQPKAAFKCRLDGERLESCDQRVKVLVPRGRHRFVARAVSVAGLMDPTPERHVWRVVRRRR